ncbi:MAG: DUF4105 domain-containing protein [Bacteroidaceae bacterium]|nr:DUF4105 domain-containing protein [Bacteroidaceae bacterium]
MKRLLLPIFICLSLFSATASNRLEVSVLTCSPGEQVYELFGHTALRVSNKQTGMDVVFNYGLFSFDEPNFIWRFVLGETDYLLGATAYQYFISEYAMRGSGVTEQVLNMDSLQAQQLFDNLRINSLLENRKYRYNFLFNNCTTKARDKIFDVFCTDSNGDTSRNIVYPVASVGDTLSFRDIIHSFTIGYPWYRFGMDLLLGAPADEIAQRDGAQFAPIIFKEELSGAMVESPLNSNVPLVKEQHELLVPEQKTIEINNLTPFNVSLLLLLFTLIVMLCEKRSKKSYWLWDLLLFGVQGVAGSILTFMVLFSQHPAVDVNWLLIWLNPLPIFLVIIYIYRLKKGVSKNVLWVEVTMIILFLLLSPFLPQYFPAPLYPCAIALLARSLFNIYKEKICALS